MDHALSFNDISFLVDTASYIRLQRTSRGFCGGEGREGCVRVSVRVWRNVQRWLDRPDLNEVVERDREMSCY